MANLRHTKGPIEPGECTHTLENRANCLQRIVRTPVTVNMPKAPAAKNSSNVKQEETENGSQVKSEPELPVTSKKRKVPSDGGEASPSPTKKGGWSGEAKAKLATFSQSIDPVLRCAEAHPTPYSLIQCLTKVTPA